MNLIQSILATISVFFSSLFGFRGTGPTPPPTDRPLTYAPASPASYPTSNYQHTKLKYSLDYPAAANVTTEENDSIVIDANALHVSPFYAPGLTMSSLLTSNLLCPTSVGHSTTCKNTAVRPLTNPTGTIGFLIRRTKIIDGATHQDTAYVFQNPNELGEGVVLGIESPTPENLRVLDDVAATFSFEK